MSVRSLAARAAACALAGALWFVPIDSHAQGTVVVVRNDRGGLLAERMREVARLRAQDARVEIRGRVCLSSCTMFLGVENVCVEPDVTFGFHGPTSYGRPLAPERFEAWSRIMAAHYPDERLRDWFLETGRHRIRGYYRVSGEQLIRMGMPRC
ncbi:hypothetical protein [Rhodosalinus sediminis]|jgi:hypothetical protein|uniref:hypothetical protein n=1 Tax=Rhodosalinus sediminis TaxID=1940533 RepID=UPI002353016D|nr:hypothetical protein [Rhodosalinus sediminis]